MKKQLLMTALIAMIAAGGVLAADDEAPRGVVNINTASADQLQMLPRVGPSLAGRIIEFRTANGPFETVDELVAVKGIGEKSLVNLEPYVATTGETTLNEKIRLPRQPKAEDES